MAEHSTAEPRILPTKSRSIMNPSEFRPSTSANGAGHGAGQDWAPYKHLLWKKYLDEGLTTKDVQLFMSATYNFHKSVQQYERIFRKWNFQKNAKRKEYEAISRTLNETKFDKENTELMINGSFIAFRKLKRQLSRHVTPTLASKWPQVSTQRMEKESSHVCHTEQPTECNDIITRSVLASGKQVCFATNLPWFHLLDVLTESYSECLKPCRYRTDDLSSRAVLISSNYETVLFDQFNKGHRANQILLTAIWRGLSSNSGTDGWTAGLRPCNLSPTQLTRSLLCLESQIPQRSSDDFKDSVKIIVGNHMPTAALIAVSYLIYLISNNLCDTYIQRDCAQLLLQLGAIPWIRSSAASGSLTAKAVLEVLLGLACRLRDLNLMASLITGKNAMSINIEIEDTRYDDEMIHNGFDYINESHDKRTPLQITVFTDGSYKDTSQKRLECTKMLLSVGASLDVCSHLFDRQQNSFDNAHCCWKCSPLQLALRTKNSSRLIRFMLEHGARVCYCLDITPMIELDADVEIDIIRMLLERGASPTYIRRSRTEEEIAHQKGCWFPLQAAMVHGRFDVAALLLEYHANVNEFSNLRCEIEDWLSGYVAKLRRSFGDDNISISDISRRREWRSPLTLCLAYDDDMASRLLDLGARMDDCHYDWIVEWKGWAATDDVDDWRSSRLSRPDNTVWLDPDDILKPRLYPFQTALEAAVSSESLKMVKTMLEQGVTPESRYSESPLAVAARIGRLDMVKLILDAGSQSDAICPLRCFDPLLRSKTHHPPILNALSEASARGHVEVMTELLDRGANINYCHEDWGVTPLHAAAICGSYSSISLLLARQPINLLCVGTWFCSIDAFAEIAWFEFNRLCMGSSEHGNHQGGMSITPSGGRYMHHITDLETSWLEMQQLYDSGATYIDSRSSAVSLESTYPAMYLADNHTSRDLGNLFFIRALQSDNYKAARSILQQGCKIQLQTTRSLLEAWSFRWKHGHIMSDNCRHAFDHLELLLASQNWSSIEEKVVDIIEVMYRTLSVMASSKIKSEVISQMHEIARDLLVYHMNDIINQRSKLFNILVNAVDIGDLESVLMLSSHDINAELDSDSRVYKTVLDVACASGHLSIVRALILAGANINRVVIGHTVSPLVLACSRGYVGIVTELVTHGADANQMAAPYENAYLRTPLQTACQFGHLNIVIVLINHNADVNALADVNIPDDEYSPVTALQAAATAGHFKIVQILIGAGAMVAAAAGPTNGRTAIDGAAEKGRLDITKFLLDKYDGDESISAVCKRAAGYARKSGFTVVVELLKSYPGANSEEWGDETSWHADSDTSSVDHETELLLDTSDDGIFEFINEDMVL